MPLIVVGVIFAAGVFLLILATIMFSRNAPEASFIERVDKTATPEELVAEMVKEIEAKVTFPETTTRYETWTGIEGRGRVLTYQFVGDTIEHLRLDAVDMNTMKEMTVFGLCGDEEMRYLLRGGVEVVYAYTVLNSPKTFSVSVTEKDCR